MLNTAIPKETLRERLRGAGFDVVRFARADGAPTTGLEAWVAAGNHADMDWMKTTTAKRGDPTLVLEGARTLILLGVNYWPADPLARSQSAWARYALNEDYHDTLKPGLVHAGRILEESFAISNLDYRYYVDTGPVMERGWASRSGMGFLGKNGMLISRDFGNWLFLSAILTRVEVEPDDSLAENFPRAAERTGVSGLLCGSCTSCMDACPTSAFPAPGVVDSRRCISYHTIENKGIIPTAIRPGIGTRVYGCDICLDVCPWNRFAQMGRSVLLNRRDDIAALTLLDLLAMTTERYREVFRHTTVKRLKLRNLLRNAAVVAGNVWSLDESSRARAGEHFAPWSDRDAGTSMLIDLARHESAIVRAHAVWALRRILGERAACDRLAELLSSETDPSVLAEHAGLPAV